MHLEAHAGLGWLIGIAATRAVPREPSADDADALARDRRLRTWCVGASVLPDIDAITYLWGERAYGDYHHTFGHNVFLGIAFALLAGWRMRSLRGHALVLVCFLSHLVTDMKLSAYPVHLLWPVSRLIDLWVVDGRPLYTLWPELHRGFEFRNNLGLAAPINTALVYLSMVMAVVVAWARGVSPLELLTPRVDRMVLNAFRSKGLACMACGAAPRPTNERCDGCATPVCTRHGRIHGWFRLACPSCSAQKS